MSLLDDERVLLNRMSATIGSNRQRNRELNAYYDGAQRLKTLGIALPPGLEDLETIVNWPRLSVDALEQRLDVEGFRRGGQDGSDDELWRRWQANDLDEESQLAHLDAFIFGRSYVCIGTNDDDETTPLVTVESPEEMTVEFDARTRRVRTSLRLYGRPLETGATGEGVATLATLYQPNVTVWLKRNSNGTGRWTEEDRDEHNLGVVPVVPLVNRARTRQRFGISEMSDVMGLTDAAARSLTNLQVAQETHAVPARGVLGATKGDFVDKNGQPLTAWESYFGAVWAITNADARTFQFAASDLRNFHDTVMHYARLVSGVTGLRPDHLGLTSDNPASADAIRSSDSRTVKRAERAQRPFGGSWEGVQRISDRIVTGEWDPTLRGLETLWRDPSTPTKAQSADAVVKLTQGDNPVLPIEAAWEELGYSATRRQQLKKLRDEQLNAGGIAAIAEQFRQPPVPTPVAG